MLKNQNKLKRSNEVVLIPARMIQPNPHQPRKNFNWDDLEGLAESIHYNGLLQPILREGYGPPASLAELFWHRPVMGSITFSSAFL